MLNNDRIVPVTKTDLLSLYRMIIQYSGQSINVLQPEDGDAAFMCPAGYNIAAVPLKSFDFSGGNTGSIYFVAERGYVGCTNENFYKSAFSDEVVPDGVTLYQATLSGQSYTISKVS